MKKVFKLGITLLTVFLASGAKAQTKEQTTRGDIPTSIKELKTNRLHLGLLAGIADAEGRYDAAGVLGITVGFQPNVPFGVGLQFMTFRNKAEDNNVDNYDHNDLVVSGSYHFSGDTLVIRDSYVGLGLGAVFNTNEKIQGSLVPMLGFDIPLKKQANDFVSLGANAQYAVVGGEDPDVLSVNGVVKYWY